MSDFNENIQDVCFEALNNGTIDYTEFAKEVALELPYTLTDALMQQIGLKDRINQLPTVLKEQYFISICDYLDTIVENISAIENLIQTTEALAENY